MKIVIKKEIFRPSLNIVVARANGKSLSQLEMLDRLMKRRTNHENR